MLTKDQFKVILQNNLSSPYMFSFQIFLTGLIKRNNYPDNVSEYRIKNTVTGSYITNVDEFSSSLDKDYIRLYFETNYRSGVSSDLPTPFTVIIDNYSVELLDYVEEDRYYINLFGLGNKKVAFTMTYLTDGDSSLPLKIVRVKLL